MTPEIKFNEDQWLKLLFLLADTHEWINDMSRDIFMQLPIPEKKQCFRKTYYLTAPAMAHIIQRHYFKINRHPQVGKFQIPVIQIMQLIRDAAQLPTTPVAGSSNFQRIMHTAEIIGYDQNGFSAKIITIITDTGGRIITAFPGVCK